MTEYSEQHNTFWESIKRKGSSDIFTSDTLLRKVYFLRDFSRFLQKYLKIVAKVQYDQNIKNDNQKNLI